MVNKRFQLMSEENIANKQKKRYGHPSVYKHKQYVGMQSVRYLASVVQCKPEKPGLSTNTTVQGAAWKAVDLFEANHHSGFWGAPYT